MARYLAVRLYSMAVTLAGLTVLTFLMLRLIPGTVVEQMIGADAVVSAAMVAQLKAFFGLDQPWYVQYGRWIGGMLHGDLGTSWRTGKPVVQLIAERLPVTLELTAFAVAVAIVLGVVAGVVSSVQRDRAVDNVTRVGALLGLSVPVFWQGTMLILFLSIYLRWMPHGGRQGPAAAARRPQARAAQRDDPDRHRGRAPDRHPARRHRRRRRGVHAARRRAPRAVVDLPARLSADPEHDPVRGRHVHVREPRRGSAVRVPRPARSLLKGTGGWPGFGPAGQLHHFATTDERPEGNVKA